MTKQAKLTNGNLPPMPISNKVMVILTLCSAITYFISTILSKFLAFILAFLIGIKLIWPFIAPYLDTYLIGYKWYRKLKFFLIFKKIQKQSKSINHTQSLLTKHMLNIPFSNDEDEITTFCDITSHFNEKFPFMVPVSETRDKKVNVRGKKVEMISSYSYLDLCRDDRIQEAAINAAKLYSTGNHGPRMLCGNLVILEDLEKTIAKFFHREAALVFSSGYLACMSSIAGLARKGDLVLMDKLSHASLKAGAKLSSAKIAYFKHNDFKDAERIIKSSKYDNIIMVIEGVYSMDGDVGYLDQARALCDKYKATLILDEAHSLGAIGKTGRGAEEMYEYKYKADILVGTFTKTIASVGGYITCSQRLRTFYTFYAPGLVFSAPLSAYHCGAAQKAFEIIEAEPERVEKLQKNAEYLRNKFVENKFNIGHTISCVIPVIFRDSVQCMNIHYYMLQHGYFSAVVMAPACPVTAPRFRITASSAMTNEEMDGIIDIFIKARDANDENAELKELLEGV
jgi:7-keto-8-aminopelargonate synthetase-like enzyme